MGKKKGFYSISVVAKMFSVHQQTIRMYEKEGLFSPKRSAGNTRLFSEEDVERLEEIINLTHKLGVNLAGVEIILKLQRKMKKMQSEMNKMFSQVSSQLDEQQESLSQDARQHVEQLVSIKKRNTGVTDEAIFSVPPKAGVPVVKRKPQELEKDKEEQATLIDDWEIEYDDEK